MKNLTSPELPWEPMFTATGEYVWHFCRECSVALNPDGRHEAWCKYAKEDKDERS